MNFPWNIRKESKELSANHQQEISEALAREAVALHRLQVLQVEARLTASRLRVDKG